MKCGSQIILCNLPIRFDTYVGCSHGCRYCFVQKKTDISQIKKDEGIESLRSFINGNRGVETNWCDWNIPIHWGGTSDPFQPIEKEVRSSYNCLKLLAETKYPLVVSTKGKLVAEDDYLELLSACNCVVQVSMVCGQYDKLEPGAPTYAERLEMVKKIAPRVRRVVVRVQPYMPEVFRDVMSNIPLLAGAGVHGIVFEGMKFLKAKRGMERVGGDFCYPVSVLRRDFERFKEACHEHGMRFYSGENRLRGMGDCMTCCGTDGLEDFVGNEYNILMMLHGKAPEPTECMQRVGTAQCFKALQQNAGSGPRLRAQSLAGIMQAELRDKKLYYKQLFGF